jgi:hypothetical protein
MAFSFALRSNLSPPSALASLSKKADFSHFPTRKYLILLKASLRKMNFPTDKTP